MAKLKHLSSTPHQNPIHFLPIPLHLNRRLSDKSVVIVCSSFWNLGGQLTQLKRPCISLLYLVQKSLITPPPPEAYATISGTKEKVITAGSEMQLVCIVKDITKTPDFFFWWDTNYSQLIQFKMLLQADI